MGRSGSFGNRSMVFRGADVGVDVVGLARLATPATPVMGGRLDALASDARETVGMKAFGIGKGGAVPCSSKRSALSSMPVGRLGRGCALLADASLEGLAVDPNSRPRRIVVRNAAGASARRAREGSVASVEFADGARKDGGALASLSRRRLRLFARIVSPVGFGPVFGKRGAGQCRARPKERLAR